tara:strand:- start:33636 stop:33983 length:348 start_codon:yes stop_codon:yes gene_type:complete
MDTWQAWAAAVVGIIVSLLTGDRMFEKRRGETRTKNLYSKIEKLEEKNTKLTERVIRVEADIMTEREVREILAEFMTPFLSSLEKIDSRTDNIDKQITSLRIYLAKRDGDEDTTV